MRARRTRSALVQAGRQVFEEVGFHGARVDDVCRGAGVSHGTFYVYFDSLTALFREVAETVVGEMFAATRVGDGPRSPRERIEAANRLYVRAWSRNARLARELDHAAATSPELRQLQLDMREAFVLRAAEGIRRLQAAGLVDQALPARLTAIALGGMVEQFAHVWLDLGEDVDEETAVALLTELWVRALRLGAGAAA